MKIFKRKCVHKWETKKQSNILRINNTGHPQRLCLYQCLKCGAYKQMWHDIEIEELKELETGKSILIKSKINI